MQSFFVELLDYSHHCNQALATAFAQTTEKTSEKANQLFCHLLNAHQIWNNRIMPIQPVFGVWQVHPLEKRAALDVENYRHTLKILSEIDLANRITYTNAKGQSFENSVRDILFQVINHSTYHRGQIALEFRQSGIEPLASDYILYKR